MRKLTGTALLLLIVGLAPTLLIARLLHAAFAIKTDTSISFWITIGSAFLALGLLAGSLLAVGWLLQPKMGRVTQARVSEITGGATHGHFPLLEIVKSADDPVQAIQIVSERIQFGDRPKTTPGDTEMVGYVLEQLRNGFRLRLPLEKPHVCEILLWRVFSLKASQQRPPKLERRNERVVLDFRDAGAIPDLINV